MRTVEQLEAEYCNTELLCPKCNMWMKYPWWKFVERNDGTCPYCDTYYEDLSILQSEADW